MIMLKRIFNFLRGVFTPSVEHVIDPEVPQEHIRTVEPIDITPYCVGVVEDQQIEQVKIEEVTVKESGTKEVSKPKKKRGRKKKTEQ